MPFNLGNFHLREITLLDSVIRAIGKGTESVEEIAERVTGILYNDLVDPDSGEKNCVLVRFFQTVNYADLDPGLRAFGARLMAGHTLLPTTRCLTLLATNGEKPEWNSRKSSSGHQTIPLVSADVLKSIPMVSQLIRQLGLSIEGVTGPPELILETDQTSYGVFYIPEAEGSASVPAQSNFVVPYRVRSVLGFGGSLPAGHIYVVLMFARIHIPQATAEIFRNAAMNLKFTLLSPPGKRIFKGADHA